MNLILELIGKKVTIHTVLADSEKQDVGILQAADSDWVKLHKESGETLYFSTGRIRMIKPF
jgi:hypothetical protein